MELLFDLVLHRGIFITAPSIFIYGWYSGLIDCVSVLFFIGVVLCLVVDILLRVVPELFKWYFEKRRLQVVFDSYSSIDSQQEIDNIRSKDNFQEDIGRIAE